MYFIVSTNNIKVYHFSIFFKIRERLWRQHCINNSTIALYAKEVGLSIPQLTGSPNTCKGSRNAVGAR